MLVCSFSLTAHWAFMYWNSQHLRNLPDVAGWSKEAKTELVSGALLMVMAASIAGNFFAAFLAKLWGYRWAIATMCLAYFFAMWQTYSVPRDHQSLLVWLPVCGFCQGVFAIFTMYMPPLFPTLLRTTGAGFCYNIGRLVAAAGTVFFGVFAKVGDFRLVLLYASFLFLPAAMIAAALPEPRDRRTPHRGADARGLRKRIDVPLLGRRRTRLATPRRFHSASDKQCGCDKTSAHRCTA